MSSNPRTSMKSCSSILKSSNLLLQAPLKTTEEAVEEDKDWEAATANVAAANETLREHLFYQS